MATQPLFGTLKQEIWPTGALIHPPIDVRSFHRILIISDSLKRQKPSFRISFIAAFIVQLPVIDRNIPKLLPYELCPEIQLTHSRSSPEKGAFTDVSPKHNFPSHGILTCSGSRPDNHTISCAVMKDVHLHWQDTFLT